MTTTTTLQRLLKYPHSAVFDKAPGQDLALRLRHPDGATWVIAEEVLAVSAGGQTWEYDLTEHTVSSLANALEADGFEIAYRSSRFGGYGASVLVEGQGDQNQSNGDHIGAFTSPLWAIMGGYAREVREADYQKDQALRQMVITQAEGEWLDLWGMLYAEERFDGEADADYAQRIPKEAFRIRVNGLAIEQAIEDRTGYDIEIREPWKNLFRLDLSALSGADHFQDGRYYSYFVIQPVSRGPVDWSKIIPVIDRNRAAGIEIYSPAIELPVKHVTVQPPAEYLVGLSGFELRGLATWPITEVPLGVMRLDDNEIGLNHPMVSFHLWGISNAVGLAMDDASVKIIDPRDIAMASITLSDGVPLGNENAILSRGVEFLDAVPPATLSDELAPSDYDIVSDIERVERITLVERFYGFEYPVNEMAVGLVLTSETTYRVGVIRHKDRTWEGAWDDVTWFDPHVMGMTVSSLEVGDVLDYNLFLDLSTITFGAFGATLDVSLVLDQSELP